MFEGVGVDGLYLHFHKANQFLGMEELPTFICNDVIKQPDVPRDIERYRTHLSQIFVNYKHTGKMRRKHYVNCGCRNLRQAKPSSGGAGCYQ